MGRLYQKIMNQPLLRRNWSKFSSSFHIMLAAVTRYAVGLVYILEQGSDPETELEMLENMLLKEYTKQPE